MSMAEAEVVPCFSWASLELQDANPKFPTNPLGILGSNLSSLRYLDPLLGSGSSDICRVI